MTDEAEVLILGGSARGDGDTAGAVGRLTSALHPHRVELIDLARCDLRPFDYARPEQPDDFARIVERFLAHRTVVLATPVYWYAMSGVMKTFFDRLSDLLSPRDSLRRGRALAGRRMGMLAVGTDPELPEGFETPFLATAAYLRLEWLGACYCRTGNSACPEEDDRLVADFAARIAPMTSH